METNINPKLGEYYLLLLNFGDLKILNFFYVFIPYYYCPRHHLFNFSCYFSLLDIITYSISLKCFFDFFYTDFTAKWQWFNSYQASSINHASLFSQVFSGRKVNKKEKKENKNIIINLCILN